MLWYQIRKYIGSYVAALDGVDAIVFTGGIGENGQFIRADICGNLSYLGVEIDNAINAKALHGVEAEISTPASKVLHFCHPHRGRIDDRARYEGDRRGDVIHPFVVFLKRAVGKMFFILQQFF